MGMWILFCIAALVSLLLLVVPGCLLLRTFRLPWLMALALSAPVTIACGQIMMMAYSLLHVRVTPLTFVLPLGFVLIICVCVSEVIAHAHHVRTQASSSAARDASPRPSRLAPIARVLRFPLKASERYWFFVPFAVGIILTVFIDMKALDGPLSFSQHYDTAWHYSIVQHFMDSGNYSTLHSGAIVPTVGSTFYPTGWHALVALTAVICHAPVTLAANAVNAAVLAFIVPASWLVLSRWLFRNSAQQWAMSAAVCMLFVPYPWRLLSFGPLFSNFLSFAILPILLFEGLAIFDARTSWRTRGALIPLFIVSAIGVAISQPNGIFTAAIILAVYLFSQVSSYVRQTGITAQWVRVCVATLIDIVLAGAIVVIWIALFRAPFMQRTVTFNWPNLLGVQQAVSNALSLGFTQEPTPQIALAALVVIGICYTLFHREYVWLDCAYVLFLFLYALSSTTQGQMKQLLTGFWYTDPFRLAANAILPAIPLAGLGLWVSATIALKLANGVIADLSGSGHTFARNGFVTFLVIVLAIFSVRPQVGFGKITLKQGFSPVINDLAKDNDSHNVSHQIYTLAEQDFVQRAEKITRSDVVINQPFDGSCFAYSLNGMNVLYKSLDGNWMGDPTKDSITLIHGMGNLTDPSVRAAVRRLHVKYVLVLGDRSGFKPIKSIPGWVRDKGAGVDYGLDEWGQMDALAHRRHIPGMKLVLNDGQNKLYRIVL